MDYRVSEFQSGEKRTHTLYAGPYYGVALVTDGSAHIRWQKQHFPCGKESLVLVRPGESMLLDLPDGKYPSRVLWVQLSPRLLAQLSTETVDLEASFSVVPYRVTVVHADSELSMLCKSVARKLMALPGEADEFAAELYEKGLLEMFAVLVLRACIRAERHQAAASRRHLMLDEVFLYIHAHITEEITLQQLERAFYVDRCHIAREFKKQTGQTVHAYIVKTKLALCCRYIEQGLPITQVYQMAGFGGYSNFFRAFKREYGMTPKTYFRTVRAGAHGAPLPEQKTGPQRDFAGGS